MALRSVLQLYSFGEGVAAVRQARRVAAGIRAPSRNVVPVHSEVELRPEHNRQSLRRSNILAPLQPLRYYLNTKPFLPDCVSSIMAEVAAAGVARAALQLHPSPRARESRRMPAPWPQEQGEGLSHWQKHLRASLPALQMNAAGWHWLRKLMGAGSRAEGGTAAPA